MSPEWLMVPAGILTSYTDLRMRRVHDLHSLPFGLFAGAWQLVTGRFSHYLLYAGLGVALALALLAVRAWRSGDAVMFISYTLAHPAPLTLLVNSLIVALPFMAYALYRHEKGFPLAPSLFGGFLLTWMGVEVI